MFWGGAGFTLRWITAALNTQASGIRDCLAKLDELAADAERSARSIAANAPDVALGIKVASARSDLGIQLKRMLGTTSNFPNISTQLGVFAGALLAADTQCGFHPSQCHYDAIREKQQGVRSAILSVADTTWAWKIFRHPRTKD